MVPLPPRIRPHGPRARRRAELEQRSVPACRFFSNFVPRSLMEHGGLVPFLTPPLYADQNRLIGREARQDLVDGLVCQTKDNRLYNELISGLLEHDGWYGI